MRIVVPCAIALLAACAPPEPPPVTGEVTGRWHGQRWQGNARVYWLSRYGADGSLDIEFLTCYAGKALDRSHEYGQGRFEDGVLHTELDRIVSGDGETWVAGVDDRNRDGTPDDPHSVSYRMLELTGERMLYQSIDEGTRFEARRVEDDFRLACPPPRSVVDTSPGGRRGKDAWIRRGVGEEDADTVAVPELELRELLGGETVTED